MKLKGDIRIAGRAYLKGTDIPWYQIYPFFLIHMLCFGATGFFMAYADKPAPLYFLYLHGGFAILVYTLFYVSIFGLDEIKWVFINAGLGLFVIYNQVGWLLSIFGKNISDYPIYVHGIPFLYFILYTFLLRQAVLDLLKAREDDLKRKKLEYVYVIVFVVIQILFYVLERR